METLNSVTRVNINQDYYKVTYLEHKNRKSWISPIRVISHPYRSTITDSWFVNILLFPSDNHAGKPIVTRMSLDDCNIPENKYNHHRLFNSRSDAEKYINSEVTKVCKTGIAKSYLF